MADESKGTNDVVHPVTTNTLGEVVEKQATTNHDGALDLFEGQEGEFTYTAKEERRVLWKLDLTLLPMVGHKIDLWMALTAN